MKSNTFLALLPIAACLWSALPASAQKATQEVSMKIDVVAWGETITGLTIKSNKAGTPVTALAFRYSKPVTYSGPNILEISQTPEGAALPGAPAAAHGTAPRTAAPHATAPTTDAATATPTATPPADPPTDAAPADAPADATPADAAAQIPAALLARRKDNPNLVALALLPPDSKHVTVLLAPAAAGTFLAYVLDDDPSKLPFGRMRIHNLSPHFIAMRCNNATVSKLHTKDTVVVAPKNREVIYELAYQKDGEWVEQENNLATVKDDEQVQLVVLQSNATFFASTDGSRAGFLQTVVLRRNKNDLGVLTELDAATKAAIVARNLAEEEAAERKANHKPAAPKKPQ